MRDQREDPVDGRADDEHKQQNAAANHRGSRPQDRKDAQNGHHQGKHGQHQVTWDHTPRLTPG
jgi:hypothetical protein